MKKDNPLAFKSIIELINLPLEKINAYLDSLSNIQREGLELINSILNKEGDNDFKQGKICFPKCKTYKDRIYFAKRFHELSDKTTVKKFADFENGGEDSLIFDFPPRYIGKTKDG